MSGVWETHRKIRTMSLPRVKSARFGKLRAWKLHILRFAARAQVAGPQTLGGFKAIAMFQRGPHLKPARL